MGKERFHNFVPVKPASVWLFGMLACAGCTQTGNTTISAGGDSGPQPASVMNVADAAISGGDPNMALKVSQSVLASNPHDLDALYHEGAAYYALNRCMDSIAVYQVALTVDAKSAEAETGIGRCLLRRNAIEAEQAFTAAVQDDPNNAAALNDLGIARDLQGNHAGAIAPYKQALLLEPGATSTEVNLGMSLALSGDGDDALQYLGPLATSTEATPKIRQDYAAALVAAGRGDEARAVLAVDLPPDGVDQLMADFSAAIAAGQPRVTANVPAAAPAAPAPAEPATPAAVQATPLTDAAPAPAAATPIAVAPVAAPAAVAAQAATPPAAATPSPAPTVITPTPSPADQAAAAPAPAAMAPASLPAASMAAPADTSSDSAPPVIQPVSPPPGASNGSTPPSSAAADKIVR
jgi:Flp pilus assembly protein TadD